MKSQMYKQRRRARNEFWFRLVRVITIANCAGMVLIIYMLATIVGCK